MGRLTLAIKVQRFNSQNRPHVVALNYIDFWLRGSCGLPGLSHPRWEESLPSPSLPATLPVLVLRSAPHNNEEIFHISLVASQLVLCLSLFTQSPWQRESRKCFVFFFFFLFLSLISRFGFPFEHTHVTHPVTSNHFFFHFKKKRIIVTA